MNPSDWINLVSAIGTVGATFVALWLALSTHRQCLDCVFMWESATRDIPTIVINNIGSHTAIIETVELYFLKEKIAHIDVLRQSSYSKHAIIGPGNGCIIPLKAEDIKLDKFNKDPDKIHKLTATIKTTKGKTFKSSYMYSYNELLGFLFAAEFEDS